MPYKVDRILCPLALTETSEVILIRALHEAEAHDAGVEVLHVIDLPAGNLIMPAITFMGEKRFDELVRERHDETRDFINGKIDEIIRRADEVIPGVDASRIKKTHVHEGDPIVEILDLAGKIEADMLVMGTHGKGLIDQTFLGNVAQKVLRRITIPVLLVPSVPAAKVWE
jgi:nucleotide-binding universal stress UspA family protein